MPVAPHLCARAPFAPTLPAANRAAAASVTTSCRIRRKTSLLSSHLCHLALLHHPRVQRPPWSAQNLAGLTPFLAATRLLSSWCVKAHSGDFRPLARKILPSRGSCHSASMTCHPRCNARLTSRPRTLRWKWGCQLKVTAVSTLYVARLTPPSTSLQMSSSPTPIHLQMVHRPALFLLCCLHHLHRCRPLLPGYSRILLFILRRLCPWQCRCRVVTSVHPLRLRDG